MNPSIKTSNTNLLTSEHEIIELKRTFMILKNILKQVKELDNHAKISEEIP